jgi:hypothetical protein
MIWNECTLLEQLQNKKISNAQCEIQWNGKNEPTVKITTLGNTYYLHSKMAPWVQGRRFAMEKFVMCKNLVLYGLGLGYHVHAMAEMLQEGQILHVMECNMELIKIAFENTDILSLFKKRNVVLYASEDINEISEIINYISKLEDMEFIIYEPCLKAVPQKLLKLKDVLESWLVDTKSYNKFKDIMRTNYNMNIDQNYPNAARIFNHQFKNVPCIIVSAGPSLNDNVKELKLAKDKALIIVIGRAAKLLEDCNIMSDLLIETDCQSFVVNHLIGLKNQSVPLAMMATAAYTLNYGYEGDKLLLYDSSFCPEKEKDFAIESGGSVATAALSLAVEMGCNPIILIGQDLCYTDTQTHYDTAANVLQTGEGKWIEGIDGRQYYTTPSLYSFLRWFERKIAKHPEVQFINSTARGAAIAGTRTIPVDKVLSDLPNWSQKYNEKLKEIVAKNRLIEEVSIFTCTIQFIDRN